MRISAFVFSMVFCSGNLLLAASSSGQNMMEKRITLELNKESLRSAIKKIEKVSGFRMAYALEQVAPFANITLEKQNRSVDQTLRQVLQGTGLQHKERPNSTILIYKERKNHSLASAGSEFDQLENLEMDGDMVLAEIIKGAVKDKETGAALPGVTVLIKNSSIGTTTDSEGKYSISVPSGVKDAILVFSYIGYLKEEVATANRTVIDLALTANAQELDLVTVSYGVQKMKAVTGSIAQVSAAKMEDMPVGTFAQRLQGKLTGVQVGQGTGQPGQGMNFRIRGAASLNAGNDPLFVVDGQPITGNINNINPDEIESFTVLKDASATALYGSRASSGVILITTKQAQAGKTRIDFNSNYGVQKLPMRGRPEMLNGREFATYMNGFFEDKIKYEGWKDPATGLAQVPEEYRDPSKYGEGTDWLQALLRSASVQNYSLSVSNAGEKYSSSIVLGHYNQQGILVGTNYKRFSLRSNNEFRPHQKVKIGLNLAPSLQLDHNNRSNSDGQRQIVEGSLLFSPLQSPINPDGSLPTSIQGYNMFGNPNWYRRLLESKDDYKTSRLLANTYLEVDIWKGIKFKTRADIDMGEEAYDYFMPSTSQGGFASPPPQRASGTSRNTNYYSWLNENILSYQRSFGEHSLDVLAGYTSQKYRMEMKQVNGTDFPDDAIKWLNVAATTSGSSSTQSWSLLSMIGRINYAFRDKYFLTASIRRDGSSRFGADNRWGAFPSASLGWTISDEDFMKKVPVVSFLKVRTSYGITGNNNIGNYTAASLIGNSNYIFGGTLTPGKAVSSLGNSLLSWEKNKQFDAGVDIGLFKDRISITYDYYNRITDGLLYRVDVPQASGFSSINSNVGTFKFWGHEIGISSKNLTGALRWNTDFNISFNRNLVTKLGTSNLPIGPGNEYNDPWRTEVGRPMGQFYGYVYDGVFMNQAEFDKGPKHASSAVGTVRMKDLNGDGIIDATNDRTFLGDPNPDFLFGMTNELYYKNWDLNVVFSGAVGGLIRDGMAESSLNLDGVFNVNKVALNRWRSEENPGDGVIPRTQNGTTTLFRTVHSYFIYKASYLTAKNISVGYTFRKPINYIDRLRLYVSIQQAFILTNFPGMNPEVGSLSGASLGNDGTAYPVPRTVSAGLSIGF